MGARRPLYPRAASRILRGEHRCRRRAQGGGEARARSLRRRLPRGAARHDGVRHYRRSFAYTAHRGRTGHHGARDEPASLRAAWGGKRARRRPGSDAPLRRAACSRGSHPSRRRLVRETPAMNLQLFSLEAGHELGKNVSAKLDVPLSPHEEREFEDGEHKARPLVNVRGNDVFVIESLYGDSRHSVNDKLARLLFFLGALRDASAGRVTAVVPYLAYARKDRKTKPRDPVTTRYVAALFEAVGIDRILVMDVHNPAAYQNAFRCRSDHLEARPIFVRYFASLAEIGKGELVVLSPDAGGVKRAESFRQHLERVLGTGIRNAFMEKQRSGGVVSGETLVGAVEEIGR